MALNAQSVRLANGLRLATVPMPNVESAAMGIWVEVGGRHEPAALNGISHFIEHMLFKGTKSRSAREISEAIEGRGGYFNASTQEESTCYYARLAAEHTVEAFEILADMYRHPRFAPQDIERERGVILEEIAMYRDQPASVAEEMLHSLLWPHHPLGRPLTGTERVIRRITRSDLLTFKEQRYSPDQTLVLFAGAVEHQKALEMTARLMPRAPSRITPRVRLLRPPVRQKSFAAQQRKVEQMNLAIGFRTFGRHDPRRYALKLLSVILGENMSSRLFQSVREKHGLAYSIQTGVSLFADTGFLNMSAGVDVERASRAVRLIARELSQISRIKVSTGELRRAKDFTTGQLRLALEGSGERLTWTAEHLLGFGRLIEPEEYIERFNAVTADNIRAVAQAVLRNRHASMAVVSPCSEAVAKKLFHDDFSSLLYG